MDDAWECFGSLKPFIDAGKKNIQGNKKATEKQ